MQTCSHVNLSLKYASNRVVKYVHVCWCDAVVSFLDLLPRKAYAWQTQRYVVLLPKVQGLVYLHKYLVLGTVPNVCADQKPCRRGRRTSNWGITGQSCIVWLSENSVFAYPFLHSLPSYLPASEWSLDLGLKSKCWLHLFCYREFKVTLPSWCIAVKAEPCLCYLACARVAGACFWGEQNR